MTLLHMSDSANRIGLNAQSSSQPTSGRAARQSSGSDRIRVLVIDDSDVARAAMVDLLQGAGMETFELASAIGATRTLMRNDIHAVVADVSMPGLSGDKLVGVLRKNTRFSHLAVLLVSGRSEEELHQISLEQDVDAVLSKRDLAEALVMTVVRATSFRQKAAAR
jgi:CheY-like chemotaxis protein